MSKDTIIPSLITCILTLVVASCLPLMGFCPCPRPDHHAPAPDAGPDAQPDVTEPPRDPMAELAPNAIYDQSNYTGSLSDITDSPSAPDDNWMTPTAAGNAQLGVDFPTPGGALDGTQTFSVWARGVSAGVNSPAMEIFLYEGPTVISGSGASFVTSTSGQLLTHTWDAADVTNPADVRCLVVMTESPLLHQADIGAVAWTANVAVEVTGTEWDLVAPGASYDMVAP